MSIAGVRDGFNEVSIPAGITCTMALMNTVRAQDVEWTVLTFHGIDALGAPFEINSARIRPGGSNVEAARETALRQIDIGKPIA